MCTKEQQSAVTQPLLSSIIILRIYTSSQGTKIQYNYLLVQAFAQRLQCKCVYVLTIAAEFISPLEHQQEEEEEAAASRVNIKSFLCVWTHQEIHVVVPSAVLLLFLFAR